MAKITYIEASGEAHVVDARVGETVMEAAVKYGVPGIAAVCGGACACGTCRIYVDPEWQSRTGEANEMERDMIEFLEEGAGTSRLSCQIKVSEDLDGLVVRMPESQQ